jgi:tetratricopeptide (TPR) repeat protein
MAAVSTVSRTFFRTRERFVNNDERARVVRQLTQQAIRQALDNQWEEAVASNRELLKIVQRNSETLNRLGKALSELGRYDEAKKAYNESLQINPENAIARKNLDRLALLSEQGVQIPIGSSNERVDPRLFIEEIGKTGVTLLVNLAVREVLARLNAGDQVYPFADGHILFIRTSRGEIIGQVEPVLANRLIKFIQGGNQYTAAITEISDSQVRVIIRETYQHPSQIGKVSFPALGAGALPRADIRDTLVRDHDEEMDYYEDIDDDIEDLDEDYTDEADDDIADNLDDSDTGDTE